MRDLRAQVLVLAACVGKKRRARRRVEFQGRFEHLLDALPALGFHDRLGVSSWPYNHALATLQSRRTVRLDTPSTSAVSSSFSPPKNRSSTIRLRRASNCAKRESASSSATRSSDGFPVIRSASSRQTFCCPPPRLAARRLRA